MELWGLTGGIACGKSTVAAILREQGAAIVDADALAREVVAPGSDGLAALVARFGPGILEPDGQLARKTLGALVFQDAAARRDLNAITHPRIAQLSAQRTMEAQEKGALVCVYDAPLLVENGLHLGMREVLVVAASPDVQLARLMARDGSSREDALARINSQAPLEEKRRVASHVFENNGSPADLRAQVLAFWQRVQPRLVG